MTKVTQPLILASELLNDTSAIIKAIGVAKAETMTLQRSYQVLACSVVRHLGINKDIHLVRRLFENMPDSLNVNSMKEFMNKYAAVKFDDEGEVHFDKTKETKLAESMEKAWWKAKPQTPYKPFNLVAELDKLLKRANTKLEKPKEGDEVDSEQLEALRKVYYTIKGTDTPEENKGTPEASTEPVDPLMDIAA